MKNKLDSNCRFHIPQFDGSHCGCVGYVQCTVFSVQYTVYSVQCTVYSVQCTVYSVQQCIYLSLLADHRDISRGTFILSFMYRSPTSHPTIYRIYNIFNSTLCLLVLMSDHNSATLKPICIEIYLESSGEPRKCFWHAKLSGLTFVGKNSINRNLRPSAGKLRK